MRYRFCFLISFLFPACTPKKGNFTDPSGKIDSRGDCAIADVDKIAITISGEKQMHTKNESRRGKVCQFVHYVKLMHDRFQALIRSSTTGERHRGRIATPTRMRAFSDGKISCSNLRENKESRSKVLTIGVGMNLKVLERAQEDLKVDIEFVAVTPNLIAVTT